MWPIQQPTRTATEAFLTCLARTRQPLRGRLEALTPSVKEAAVQFQAAAQSATLYLLDSSSFTPASTNLPEDLVKIYTDRMAKVGAPGREIYDELRFATRRCPLCGHRDATTLDHHLPKTKFPLLSVAPDNLVPSCAECNKKKLDELPASAETQTLHPYFDKVDDVAWLAAEIVEETPPVVRFFVSPSPTWPSHLTARVNHHFNIFKLANLYSVQAGDELAGIAYYLQIQFDAAGQQAVKEYLAEMAISRSITRLNSWTAATYRAMAASTWFCAGGFRLT
jgi:hypothetical protein